MRIYFFDFTRATEAVPQTVREAAMIPYTAISEEPVLGEIGLVSFTQTTLALSFVQGLQGEVQGAVVATGL